MIPLWQFAFGLIVVYFLHNAVRSYRRHAQAHTTHLAGPPSPSWLFGLSKQLGARSDAISMYDRWVEQYGSVFRIPLPFGSHRIIITDPKAIAHFYSLETKTYVYSRLSKVFIDNLFGRGLIWAEGDSHKRQRKAISPAFNNAAIRHLTSVFYDCVYKLKTTWDNKQLASGDSAVIDIQNAMNHVSLDTIGITGFSHDFGSLDGKRSDVAEVFDAMGHVKPSLLTATVYAFGHVFPFLGRMPTDIRRLEVKFNKCIEDIAVVLLENTRKEMNGLGENDKEDNSIIGLLIKAEDTKSSLRMSQEEIMAQIKLLILAGYETTSISLTWALIELSRKPAIQDSLREEITKQFPNSDPTWEQLTNGVELRYLDAVVHEILRLHAPVATTIRVAAKDDILPLSRPLRTATGQLVDHVVVAEGQAIAVPISHMNTSLLYWGPDALEFRPERWLTEDGIPKMAQEVQGHRHLLTFVDGQRMCLGRGFALSDIKVILGVLIKNYTFEFPGGPETKIELCEGILPRPGVAGEKGACVPLRVRRVDA